MRWIMEMNNVMFNSSKTEVLFVGIASEAENVFCLLGTE